MSRIGFNQPLYIPPFDHRGSFATKMFIGCAVERADFWDPLVNFRAGQITRVAAGQEIAGHYADFAKTFTTAQPH